MRQEACTKRGREALQAMQEQHEPVPIHIRIDTQEQRSGIPDLLASMPQVHVELTPLRMGDYDVGGDPSRFGIDVERFHAGCLQRARRFPHTLLTTMTHDAKRSADVRARIGVLSWMPDEWATHVGRWLELTEGHRSDGAPDDAEKKDEPKKPGTKKDEPKKAEGTQENRYLMVTVSFDKDIIPKPEKPAPKATARKKSSSAIQQAGYDASAGNPADARLQFLHRLAVADQLAVDAGFLDEAIVLRLERNVVPGTG